LLLLDSEECTDISEDAKEVARSIFGARCLHLEAVLEMCRDQVVTSTASSLRRGFIIHPGLFSIAAQFPKSNAADISSYLSKTIAQTLTRQRDKDFDFDSAFARDALDLMPYLIASILFAATNGNQFEFACKTFIQSLPKIKTLIGASQNSFAGYSALWIRLLKHIIDSNVNLFSAAEIQILEDHIFPDLLKIPVIMEDATALALSLPNGMQILFQCVGYYQDEALGMDSLPADVVHYIELIECVVTQNAADIRRRFRYIAAERIAKLYHANIPPALLSSRRKRLNDDTNSNILFGIKMIDNDDDEENMLSQETANEVVEKQSYMKEVEIEQEVAEMTKVELEKSVLGQNSFLGCFLSFVAAISESKLVHICIKVAALRALGSYMLYSNQLLRVYSPLLKSLLLEVYCHSDSDSKLFLPIALQALHTYLLTFRPGVSDPSLLVDFTVSELGRATHEVHCLLLLRNIVEVMVSLIKSGAVRSPEEFGVLIVLILLKFNYYQDTQPGHEHLGIISALLLHLCSWQNSFASRMCFFAINLVEEDSSSVSDDMNSKVKAKLVSYLSSQAYKGEALQIGMVQMIIDTTLCLGSTANLAQIEAVGEKLLNELILRGDEKLLSYLSLFPYTEQWRILLDSNGNVHSHNSKITAPKSFNLPPSLYEKLLYLANEKKNNYRAHVPSAPVATVSIRKNQMQDLDTERDSIFMHSDSPPKSFVEIEPCASKTKKTTKTESDSHKTTVRNRVAKRARVILSDSDSD
jgi:hypothetical protein